jgi:hypothetical protein
MNTIAPRRLALGVATVLALGAPFANGQAPSPKPVVGPETETIYSVAHVIPGREAAYAKLSAETWALYRRLDLVLPRPHVVVRGVDDAGKPYFVEIFTWKDASIPDHAPAEVRAIWKKLEAVCEPRSGRPGIDFSDGGVTLLDFD